MNLNVFFLMTTIGCYAFTALHGIELLAVDRSSPPQCRVFEDLGVTELDLANGLRVCLKPTRFEEDEVVIKMAALGGFAAVNANQRASFELAASVGLESGIGEYNADQLSVLLYEQSAEFSLGIQAFSRSIEATAGKEEVELLFKLIHSVFIHPKFTKDAFDRVVMQAKLSAEKRSSDSGRMYEEAYLTTNTQNYSVLRSLEVNDILRADFESSQKFYNEAFANPEEFVCVIVGDFNLDMMTEMIKKHLANIPVRKAQIGLSHAYLPAFPSTTITKQVKCYKNCEGLNRLTFPVKVRIDENSIHELAFVCQLLEARLRRALNKFTGSTQGIDVVYEFPFFPVLEHPWITVQFRSEEKAATLLRDKMIAELESLQTQGPSTEELTQAKVQKQQNDEFWMRENDFWVATLSNYYLVKWPLRDIFKDLKTEEWSEVSQVRAQLKRFFDLKTFTLVSSFQAS